MALFRVWHAVLVLLAALLVSCGGGGGGGDDSSFSVSFDTKSLEFSYSEGGYSGHQLVTATAHGTPPSSGVFVGATVSGSGIQQPIYIGIDQDAGKAYAYISPIEGLPAGVYSGVIKLLACTDENCSKHFSGSPHSVSYRVTVKPVLKAAPASLSFSVNERQAVSGQTLTLGLPEGTSAAQVSVAYTNGSGWLQLQNNGSSLVVTPQTGSLVPGNYQASITLSAEGGAQTVVVPVQLTVVYDATQHLRTDKSSLSLASPEGRVLSAENIQVSLPTASAGFTRSVTYGAGATGWLQVQAITGGLALTPSTVGLAPGSYTATLKLTDSTFGENVSIPVTLTVAYDALLHLRVDQTSLQFSGVETETLSAKVVEFGLPASASGLNVSVSYNAGASAWLSTSKSGNQLTVTANTAGLASGTYSASLLLAAAGTAETLSIPVQISLVKGFISLASDTVTVDMQSTGSGQFIVGGASGVTAAQWSASSSHPWLVLDTTSGNFGSNLQWHLDPALFGALYNNVDYTATITLSAAGLSNITKQITFKKRMHEISAIDTLALIAGESGEVLLYGDGFASVTDLAARLSVSGGLTPQSVTLLNSRMISVGFANIPEGDYVISLTSNSGIVTRAHTLRVKSAKAYPYQFIPATGAKPVMVWDAVSQAAFATDNNVGRIHRFAWDGGVFTHSATASAPVVNLAMDRTQDSLIVLMASGDLRRIDPVTMAASTITTLEDELTETYDGFRLPLMVAGDRRLHIAVGGYVSQLLSLDLHTGATTITDRDSYGGGAAPGGASGKVSPDGSRVIFAGSQYSKPAHMSVADNYLEEISAISSAPFFSRATSDRRGNRWLLDGAAMYDFDFAMQGLMFNIPDWVRLNTAMSRDGTRAYVYAINDAVVDSSGEVEALFRPRIYVYDTSPLPPALSSFPLLGYFELNDYTACLQWGECSPVPSLVLTPDDRNIVMVGYRGFLTAPVPDKYLPGYVEPQIIGVASRESRSVRQPPVNAMKYWRLK